MNKQTAEQAKKQADLAKYRADRDHADLAWILSMPAGRRFLWDFIGDCGAFDASFESDVNRTYHNGGRRTIGLKLLARIIKESPNGYLAMQSEAIALADQERNEQTHAITA